MAYTNVAATVSGLAAMTVAGVNRVFDHPMIQVNTAELPILFIGFPEINQVVQTLLGGLAETAVVIEIIILVAPAMHSLNKANFDESVGLMDAMQAELKANTLGLGLNEWRIQMSTHQMGDTTYWAVVTTIMISGGVD